MLTAEQKSRTARFSAPPFAFLGLKRFAPEPVELDGFLAHAVWGGGGDSGSIRAWA